MDDETRSLKRTYEKRKMQVPIDCNVIFRDFFFFLWDLAKKQRKQGANLADGKLIDRLISTPSHNNLVCVAVICQSITTTISANIISFRPSSITSIYLN